MANRDRREVLRGAEIETFDLLAKVLTLQQWTELLRAPLKDAASKGNRRLAHKLVAAGAEIGDALHEAARGGHAEVVNVLLENGASVAAKDAACWTPLHWAARQGETEVVQLLVLRGADTDPLDRFKCAPLYLAVLYGHVPAALALMAAGASVDLQSRMSVVHAAVRGRHMEIVMAAIERGADLNAHDSKFQETALHAATNLSERESIDVLVEAGANIEARDRYRCTPLHNAAGRLSREPVVALLEHGADANAQDEDQDTPLHWAAAKAGMQGAAEVVDSLLRSGADETILNDQGKSAADVISISTARVSQVGGNVERVCKLLANAPADRVWRRRGYLVLCRAHPGRVQQMQNISSEHAGIVPITRKRAKEMGRPEANDRSGAGEVGPMDERGKLSADWAVVVARVLRLQEEGIFRTIVGFL